MTRTLLSKFAGILASIVVFVVVGEAAARVFGIVDMVNGTPRRLFVRTGLQDPPYRLRPNASAAWQETQVSVNSHGLRGPSVREPKGPEDSRILVLGDSVVFGSSVDDDETFPARLEERLGSRYGWRGQVLNGGVPGYSPSAELGFLELVGADLAPDRVLLGVSFNDFGETPVLNAFGVMTRRDKAGSPGWLEEHSELYLLVWWGWKFARGEHWFQQFDPDDRDKGKFAVLDRMIERSHRTFYVDPKGEAWQRVRQLLQELRARTQSMGLPLRLVIFPEKYQFGEDSFRDPQRAWLRLCDDLGIDAIDLWPAFSQAIEAGEEDLFFDAQHPNAKGLKIAAEVVAEVLAAEVAGDGES